MLREGRLAAKRRTHQKGGAPNGKRQSKDEKAAGVEGYPGGFHTQAIVSGGWGTTAALAEICNPFDFWGKPPGITPAAPMRWQSYRGAGEYDHHAISKVLEFLLAADPLHQGARWRAGAVFNAAIIGATKTLFETVTPHRLARSGIAADAAKNAEAPLLAVIEASIKWPRGVRQF